MRLMLEDGTVFMGESFGYAGAAAGEVVFNTGMVGYPESLTDPSYCGQILALTYPLAGNYGVPAFGEDERGLPVGFESARIQVTGLIVSQYVEIYSHHTAARSLGAWLIGEGIPAVTGIDTRALTKRLREKGTMLGKIETVDEETRFFDPNAANLVARVSPGEVVRLEPAGDAGTGRPPTVVLVDCGCKASIKRSLLDRGLEVVSVPHDHYFLGLDFDGVFISNGPGDPRMASAAIRHVGHALALGKPILGICLGNQILALAAGAETFKLKYGHRSQNQPCVEVSAGGEGGDGNGAGFGGPGAAASRRCVITSQNHGYAVRAGSLPDGWTTWFENANDGTVEGIRHDTKPFFGVQFHPEANPGPKDTAWIFDDFAKAVRRAAR